MPTIDDQLSIESLILTNLINNEEYARNVSPFLKVEYFEDRYKKIIFEEYVDYLNEYNSVPTKEALYLEVEVRADIDADMLDGVQKSLAEVAHHASDDKADPKWLSDTTEQYCKDRALYLAVTDAIGIIDGQDKKRDKNAIPSILSDALAVTFDTHIGHDYFDDVGERWDFMHRDEARIKFDTNWFNKVSGGGIPSKTLTAVLAASGCGKSLAMCHMAAGFTMAGKNVLYITMEMAEERISERIDANLLNTDLDDLMSLPREVYTKKLEKLRQNTVGNFVVKEYPTAGAHVGHFRHLVQELRQKKKFTPDVIFVDYLNICASSRIRGGENTYVLCKSIAEELRGLAIELDVAIITATQTNREGASASDLTMTDVSESFGIAMTLDLFIGMISTEQLAAQDQILFKCLKTRFADLSAMKPGLMGIDRPRMKLYELENNVAQQLQQHSTAVQPSFESKEHAAKDKFAGFEI